MKSEILEFYSNSELPNKELKRCYLGKKIKKTFIIHDTSLLSWIIVLVTFFVDKFPRNLSLFIVEQ